MRVLELGIETDEHVDGLFQFPITRTWNGVITISHGGKVHQFGVQHLRPGDTLKVSLPK